MILAEQMVYKPATVRGQYQPFQFELSAAEQLILSSQEIIVKKQPDPESTWEPVSVKIWTTV